jgi:flagellar basal body-associated protein FliL
VLAAAAAAAAAADADAILIFLLVGVFVFVAAVAAFFFFFFLFLLLHPICRYLGDDVDVGCCASSRDQQGIEGMEGEGKRMGLP